MNLSSLFMPREESLGFKNIRWESGQPGESCTLIQIRNTYIIIIGQERNDEDLPTSKSEQETGRALTFKP